jgi:hypothetical protein
MPFRNRNCYHCRTTSGVFLASIFAAMLPLFTLQAALSQAPAPQAQQPNKPARVRVKLEGFDIAPSSGKAPNQIGGASRGLGGITLYAPRMGKAYTLTPTFYWSSDDATLEYTFKISALSAEQSPLYTAKVTGGRFTYPADAPALTPGESYVWSVQPMIDMFGGPASASITIVGGSERSGLTAQLEMAKDPAEKPSPAEAKIMMDARMWFDAYAAYTTLIERHPKPEYYKQRAALYDQLPDTYALADADMAKATTP